MLLLHSELSYSTHEVYTTFDFRRQPDSDDMAVDCRMERGRVRVVLHPKQSVTLHTVKMTFSYPFDRETKIFLNGYQSMTDSIEHDVCDKMPGLAKIPSHLRKKYLCEQYGDYTFTEYPNKPGKLHGFTYGYLRKDKQYTLIGSLTERQGFTVIRTDPTAGIVTVEKECDGIMIEDTCPIFDLCIFRGSEEQVFDAYFEAMGVSCDAKPLFGYTSRYHLYRSISQNLMLRNLHAISASAVKTDVFEIDDGWQTKVGDWMSVDSKKFPNGIAPIARAITRSDMIPGIWLAPFVCEKDSTLFAAHPDWILSDENGQPIVAGCDATDLYALDIEKQEVKNYIRDVLRTVTNEWGCKLLKLDLLYAACLLPRKNKTRGQIMCEAMDLLREAAGDAKILACAVPLGAAFGKVDYCRVGADITTVWDNTPIKRLLHRERASTKNAILNAIYRRQLNGRAFLNDTDGFLLRKENTSLTAHQKTWLSKIAAICGGTMFTSDEIGRYNENQKDALTELMKLKEYRVISVERIKDQIFVCCEKDSDVHSVVIPLSGKI